MVRFMKHYVTDGKIKARVIYCRTTLLDGRECVTLYAKDYNRDLGKVFPESYKNASDSMSDYFETGHVRIFPGDPNYAAACGRAA